jgi:hypothetical protein
LSKMLFLLCFQRAAAGIKRINLDGLRWRVFDAKGQVSLQFLSVFFS